MAVSTEDAAGTYLEGNQKYDSTMAPLYHQDLQSTREFILSYEDMLDDFIQELRGKTKIAGEWVYSDPSKPDAYRILDEQDINFLISYVRKFLSHGARLSFQKEERIEITSRAATDGVIDFLYGHAALKYNLPLSKINMLWIEVHELIYSAMTWSTGGVAHRGILRTTISHENVLRSDSAQQKEKEKQKQGVW